MEKLRNLPGLPDLDEERRHSLTQAYDTLARLFSAQGYRVIDTPIIEPTELFLRKGGGEMAAQMYSFTDPGGNPVSLRPEFTSSIVRWFLGEDRLDILPLRAQYSGPVFRYRGDHEEYRQFHQAGVELIGSGNPEADAEVLILACQGLAALGVDNVQLVLGDLGIYKDMIGQLGLSERARVFVLNNIGRLKDGPAGLKAVEAQATKFRLISDDGWQDSALEQIVGMKDAQARHLIAGMIEQEDPEALGQRTSAEVAERLLNRIHGAKDRSKMKKALDLASKLASIEGDPDVSLAKAGELLRLHNIQSKSLDRLGEVVDLISGEDLGHTSVGINFGMARGIAYYTGTVFELLNAETGVSYGGGGRYDELARNMGGSHDLPALGFAYGMEQLLSGKPNLSKSLENSPGRTGALVVPTTTEAFKAARKVAEELRMEYGNPVEMEVSGRSLEENLAYATAIGIGEVVRVSADGERKVHSVDVQ